MSSLDHIWRGKVAKRLIQEGNERQVIIFTHDLVFLRALEDEAARQQVDFLLQTVHKSGKKIGVCNPDIPWHGMNVKRRIGFLKNILQNCNEEELKDEFKIISFGEVFYGSLREIWERFIEEVLFNDSVQRFRPSIEIKKLMRVSIGSKMVLKVYDEMSKCSRYLRGHDKAPGESSPLPNLAEMKSDLNEIESFRKEVIKLQDTTEEDRKKMLKPPNC